MSEDDSTRPEWQDYVDEMIDGIATSLRMEFMTEMDDLREEVAKLKQELSSRGSMSVDTCADMGADTPAPTFTLPDITITSGPRVATGQSALGCLSAFTTTSQRIETLRDERKAKVGVASAHTVERIGERKSALDHFLK